MNPSKPLVWTPPQMAERISERFASAFGDRLQRQTLSV